jgi:hypothetical protein
LRLRGDDCLARVDEELPERLGFLAGEDDRHGALDGTLELA